MSWQQRRARGQYIVDNEATLGPIRERRQRANRIFTVPTQYPNRPRGRFRRPQYRVVVDGDRAVDCNGPDHMLRGRKCKHMFAAEIKMRM